MVQTSVIIVLFMVFYSIYTLYIFLYFHYNFSLSHYESFCYVKCIFFQYLAFFVLVSLVIDFR